MSLTINVPEWSVWLVAGMFAISAVVNVWHAIEMRRYRRAIKEDTAND
ncbi:MAG: hypothetical protein FD152_538 [Xanthobacteraceae bacterium]|nr:MAG: hypothetical protein FD152_538 [Xanthobacteraceae bacterium]